VGNPVKIFMPDWMSRERRALIRSFGANIVEVSAAQGGDFGGASGWRRNLPPASPVATDLGLGVGISSDAISSWLFEYRMNSGPMPS